MSQGVYVGGKLAGTTALSRAQTIKLDLELKTAKRQKLVDEQAQLTKEQNDLKATGKDLEADSQQRLAALPELIKASDKEIADANAAYDRFTAGGKLGKVVLVS